MRLHSLAKKFFGKVRKHTLLTVGLLICLFAAWGLLQGFIATHRPYKLGSSSTVSHEIKLPSESPISAKTTYNVPAGQPRQIIIPSIGVQAFVQQVGVLKDDSVGVPDNINLAGWYNKSVKPGDAGLSIIDGHVHGKYAVGVFVDLAQLKPGSIFTVQFGDLSSRSFKVISNTAVSVDDANTLLFKVNKGISSQLNLITCTNYNRQTGTYDQRSIVVAQRI